MNNEARGGGGQGGHGGGYNKEGRRHNEASETAEEEILQGRWVIRRILKAPPSQFSV